MRKRIVIMLLAIALSTIAMLCTRNPIGDRILAKACILGASKYGACQLAR